MSNKKGDKTSKLEISKSYINEGYQPLGQVNLTPESLPKTPSAVSKPQINPQKGQGDSGSSSSKSSDSEL